MDSKQLFEEAQRYIPGGVNSPVRAFRSVGGTPVFIREGKGARFTDVSGKSYIDYCLSWGPLILGHAHSAVVEAAGKALARGSSYGAPTPLEVDLAKRITTLMPSIEMVRMVNSGTEATMSAIRLARAATGRAKILKFDGCYHGHADPFLSKAGSGMATLGIPSSPGVTEACAKDTLSAPFNDLGAVEEIFAREGSSIAAVILEPVVGNIGVVLPKADYLRGLRKITKEHGALMIMDEVITGFRLGLSGAQGLYGIEPDLTTLGKIIGGGLPVGAYGGRRDLMSQMAPSGPVYQAGTLAGNPVAMAAGLATLDELARPGVYEKLEKAGARLAAGIEEAARSESVPVRLNRVGSMFSVFFTEGPVESWEQVRLADSAFYGRYFHALLARGIYFAPSAFEAAFLSTAHGDAEIEETIGACREALKEAKKSGK